MSRISSLAWLAGSVLLGAQSLGAPALGAQSLDSAAVAGMRWRTVGPANFMGRMSDVVGIPGPSKTLFAAAAGGGLDDDRESDAGRYANGSFKIGHAAFGPRHDRNPQRLGGFLGKLLDFVCNHGKALSSLAGSGSLNGCIQC